MNKVSFNVLRLSFWAKFAQNATCHQTTVVFPLCVLGVFLRAFA
jgi:hypothetical protein